MEKKKLNPFDKHLNIQNANNINYNKGGLKRTPKTIIYSTNKISSASNACNTTQFIDKTSDYILRFMSITSPVTSGLIQFIPNSLQNVNLKSIYVKQ